MESLRQPTHQNTYQQTQHQFVQILAIAIIGSASVGILFQVFTGDANTFGVLIPLLYVLGGAVTLQLLSNQQIQQASILLLTLFMIGIFLLDRPPVLLISALAVLISATTLNRRLFLLINILILIRFGLFIFDNYQEFGFTFNEQAQQIGIEIFVLLAISVIVRLAFNSLITVSAISQRSSYLLESSATIGQSMSQILDLDDLLNQSIHLIRDQFAFYHVQIFLVDKTKANAQLVASTGEVGRRLLDRRHSLSVGSQSVIGRVTQLGEPIVARDTDDDVLHAQNELLPNTRSELALPLIDNHEVVGALDIQSTRANAFDLTDIRALQVMAIQLTTAIRNARLFEQQQHSLQENQQLLLKTESNLQEIERLNRQLTQTSWQEYAEQKTTIEGVTIEKNAFRPGAEWSAIMEQVQKEHRPVITPINNEKILVGIPIILRREVIGVIEIETGTQGQSTNFLDTLNAVSQRLAISLENARLFEETQKATLQEQIINEIGLQYQSATTLDDLLQITLHEMQDILGVESGSIRLSTIDALAENGEVEA